MRAESLDEKILRDFHGFAPTIDESMQGNYLQSHLRHKYILLKLLNLVSFLGLVNGGGCSGFNYLLDIDTNMAEDDIQFSESPPAIIDTESLKYLYGSEVDLQDHMMNKMLVVKNPSAKASCGCGTSFAVDEKMLDYYN